MKTFGFVCEIMECSQIGKKPMVSILKNPAVVPYLKPNDSRHGTLVLLCPAHKKEFGIKQENSVEK